MLTVREELWRGEFGDVFFEIGGQTSSALHEYRLRDALGKREIGSVMEFGAGRGEALRAVKAIYPEVRTAAVELNAGVCERLRGFVDDVTCGSMFDVPTDATYDLVIANGLLSCLMPEQFDAAYEILVRVGKALWIYDYFAAKPREFSHSALGIMYSRDWGTEVAAKTGLRVTASHYLASDPAGTMGWWLLER